MATVGTPESQAHSAGRATSALKPAERRRLKKLLERGGFTALGDANPDGVYAYDLDGNFIAASAVFFGRSGFPAEEMEKRIFGSSAIEEHKEMMRENFAAVVAGEARTWPATVYTKSGSLVRVLTTAFPFYADGIRHAVIGIVRDIELLEQTREHARKLEDRLTQTLDSMTDAIVFIDRDWELTYLNRRALEAIGASAQELLGKNFWEQFAGTMTAEEEEIFRGVMDGGAREQFRSHSSYENRWVEVTTYPTADGIAMYSRDIEEAEQARQLLDKTERRTITQAALLDAARDAMVVRNLDGSIAYWNQAASDLYGWSSTEAVGSLARDLLYDEPIQYDKAVIEVLTAGYWFGTLNQRTRDGRKIIVEGRWTLVHTPDGEPDSIFIVNSDITLQVQQEQQHLRTQRMESLGLLAGGIAHDLNNVLTPILMSAQLLAEAHSSEADRKLAIGIERAAMRGADLIRQVLSFARGDDGARDRIDVRALLADLNSFCRQTLPKNIVVTVGAAKNLADVCGDSTQLMQVLINLVVNARDAMPNGGSLRIAAFNNPATVANSEMVAIEIEDNGTGMDAATLETIFDPFFTTKLLGSGTGLGLATSLSITQRHDGTLTATSAQGSGTLLRLELPALPADGEEAPKPADAATPVVPRGDGEYVLVVDDESAIRQVSCHTLESAGYRTLVASNGKEALSVYEAHSAAIGLVLTDLMMPVMDGVEMSRALRATGYTGPILATSGGARSTAPIDEIEGTRFLGKPYTTHDLLRAVHELIAGENS